PSRAFLQDRSLSEVGNVVHVALEGSRPLLVELQSLTTPSRFGAPRRSVNGIDLNRLHMLVAVLERRAHLDLGGDDVFVNAAGGTRTVTGSSQESSIPRAAGEGPPNRGTQHSRLICSTAASSLMPRAWPRIRSMQRRCRIRTLTFSGAMPLGGRVAEAFATGSDAKARARTKPADASQQVRSRLWAEAVGLRGQKERRRPVFML